MKDQKTAFITGGSGFVGQNLIPYLIEKGYSVLALARSDKSTKIVETLGATSIRGDLDNLEAIEKGTKACNSVFHLAASVDFFASIDKLRKLHVEATRNLIEIAKKNEVSRFVYLGAASVALNGEPLKNVNVDFVPEKFTDGYSQTKYEAEKLVLEANSQQLETIAVRPPMIWGKGDPNVLPAIIEAINKKQMMLIGGGTHRFVTCHVLNVCHALYLADHVSVSGNKYFITDLEQPVFKEFIAKYVGTQGIKLPQISVPLGMAKFFASLLAIIWKTFNLKGHPPIYPGLVNVMGMEFTVETQNTVDELGYKPIISIEEGIKMMK